MMIDILARASVDGGLIVGVVWIINHAVRLSPAARATLWWCAAAKFVMTLAWVTPVGVPILPGTMPLVATGGSSISTPSTRAADEGTIEPPAGARGGGGNSRSNALSWTSVLVSLWALGVAVSGGLAAWRWRQSRRVVMRSICAGSRLQQSVDDLAAIVGLHRVPRVRLSDEVESPLITGLRDPVILVPATRFSQLSEDQQRMALCHELAHVRRGDVWLGCIPAVAERIFFFHPLARLAAREYVFWREAACDAAVLAALETAPQAYGRLLLDLGVARPPATLGAAGAAWSFSSLKRRITMLSHPSKPSVRGRIVASATVALAVFAIAPLRLVARPSAPVAAGSEAVVPAKAPVVRQSEVPPEPQSKRRTAPEDDLRFVFLRGNRQTTMSGSTGDVERARRLQKSGEQLLWLIKDGKQYVVRDPNLLRELQNIWETVSRVGDEQGKVGEKQGALGTRQGELGANQGKLGAEQGLIGTRQGQVGSRQGLLASREGRRLTSVERAEIERERQELDQQMRTLDREMALLGEKMQELDKPMRELGDQMEILGREMDLLGRKMEEASAKADTEMRRLIERAIASGAAEVVG
ncbi:MAG: hypothetical protein H0W08_15685 [Acidobacteria bacterium]|nr:hypothetical protein [Acidobacteriota bacterium]